MSATAAPDAAAQRAETRALLVSLIVSIALGAGALIWGILSGSSVILFDGVLMLAGIALVAISLLASRAATSKPTPEYPFGRHAATPLAVALQGAALLGTLVYGAADAIAVIIAGGSQAAAGQVLAYGLTSGLISAAVVLWFRRPARSSALARAELVSWRAGALLSGMVAVGGAAGLALTAMSHASAARYVDPTLVLLACASIIPMAVHLVRDGVRELLEAAPTSAVRAAIDAAVADVRRVHGLPEPLIRSTKLGRRLYVEVDFVVEVGTWSVDEEDEVRRELIALLDALDYEVWATVDLTTDSRLTQS